MTLDSPKNGELGSQIVIIIPLYNEFKRGSFSYIESLLKIKNCHFILVNDGSTDETSKNLTSFSKYKNVVVTEHEVNQGKAEAIRTGINLALGYDMYSLIGYLDGDGAFSISEIIRNIELAETKLTSGGFEVFATSRVALSGREIERKLQRHIIGRIVRTLIEIRHRDLPYDTQSGFKIFKEGASLRQAAESEFRTKWFADVEILLRMKKKTSNLMIWEEPLLQWRDVNASSLGWKSAPTVIKELAIILSRS
jgi:dolichyl-phosphate beta-glucosyltransferase